MIVKIIKCFAYIAQPPYLVPPPGATGSNDPDIKTETNGQATNQCKNVYAYRNCK